MQTEPSPRPAAKCLLPQDGQLSAAPGGATASPGRFQGLEGPPVSGEVMAPFPQASLVSTLVHHLGESSSGLGPSHLPCPRPCNMTSPLDRQEDSLAVHCVED